jgi:hypothetical protein
VCDGKASPPSCRPGGGCGGQRIAARPVAPNLLLVLDRSCSMNSKILTVPKWSSAVAAIEKLTADYAGRIDFGLTLFPDRGGDKCSQGAIPIPVGPGNEPAIDALLTAALDPADPNHPGDPCGTPIDTAMLQAATDPGLADPSRPSFVALITDGQQSSCSAGGGDAGTTRTITDLLARGVGTFVVGFDARAAGDQLDVFAQAGGHPTGAASPKFYDAADPQALDGALAALAGQTVGCAYQLANPPPDPSLLYLFTDAGDEIPRDPNHGDGWDYDPATSIVRLYGAACDALRAGSVTAIDVVYGCEAPPPG